MKSYRKYKRDRKISQVRSELFQSRKARRSKKSPKSTDIIFGFKHKVFNDGVISCGFDGIFTNGIDYFEISNVGGVLTIVPLKGCPYFINGKISKSYK